jgi:hypothetical protein
MALKFFTLLPSNGRTKTGASPAQNGKCAPHYGAREIVARFTAPPPLDYYGPEATVIGERVGSELFRLRAYAAAHQAA